MTVQGRIVAAFAFALVAGCTSGSGMAPEPPRRVLEVYGCDITAEWANVSVSFQGAPYDGAFVAVNGASLLPGAMAGSYQGPLPSKLAAGDPISLEVTAMDLAVTASGEFPDGPFIESAYTSAAVASDGAIVVSWTSPTDPDAFAVSATWSCGADCGAGASFPAPGSARTLTIPAGSIPRGHDVEVAVFAYDDGSFTGDYEPYPASPGMNIRAESSRIAVSTGFTSPPPPRLQVYGRDIGDLAANVDVKRNGQPIDGAVVVVNGVVLSPRPGQAGTYSAYFDAPLSARSAVSLDVAAGDLRVTGLGALPDAPVLTSPWDGQWFTPGEDVTVTWTSPSDPDYFEVYAGWSCGYGCGTGIWLEAAGTERTLTIPTASLPTMGLVDVSVFAYDDGSLSGDYEPWAPYPGMNIRAESNQVTVDRVLY